MTAIIELDSELIIDRSGVFNPYLRLLLVAIGQNLARGSPWVAIDKRVAAEYELRVPPIENSGHDIAA